jgi:hypothetical protein
MGFVLLFQELQLLFADLEENNIEMGAGDPTKAVNLFKHLLSN